MSLLNPHGLYLSKWDLEVELTFRIPPRLADMYHLTHFYSFVLDPFEDTPQRSSVLHQNV